MNRKACLLTVVSVLALGVPAAAFSAAPPGALSSPVKYAGAMTPQGIPNLEGTWTNITMSRFERAREFGNRLVMTEAEVAQAEGGAARIAALGAAPTDPKATVKDLPNDCSNGRNWCNTNAAWGDKEAHIMRIHGQPRTSLITFPADGRVPYRPEKAPKPQPVDPILGPGLGILDNPEDRPLPERCLVSQNFRNGALMTPTLYNNNMQIVQSKDTVAIMVEMSHEARLVRMGGAHRTDGVKPWFGDSIGRYEGPTLVVETTNFHPAQLTRESPKLKITERFTRTAKDKVLYQFTVDDPDTYTQPWGGEYEFAASPGQIFEYACHEGNRGMEGLLIGARQMEKEAAGATRPQASR